MVHNYAFDWIQLAIAQGKGYHMDVGAFSTPIVGGGNGTVIDQNQPEAIVSCPAGKKIAIIRAAVDCLVPLLATDEDEAEILLAADIVAAYAGDGTVTAETPINMNTGAGLSSSCNCASAATADITNPTLGLELAREIIVGDVQGTPATAIWTPLKMRFEPAHPMFLSGPCAVYLYFGGTVAVSGFAQIEWIEDDDF